MFGLVVDGLVKKENDCNQASESFGLDFGFGFDLVLDSVLVFVWSGLVWYRFGLPSGSGFVWSIGFSIGLSGKRSTQESQNYPKKGSQNPASGPPRRAPGTLRSAKNEAWDRFGKALKKEVAPNALRNDLFARFWRFLGPPWGPKNHPKSTFSQKSRPREGSFIDPCCKRRFSRFFFRFLLDFGPEIDVFCGVFSPPLARFS